MRLILAIALTAAALGAAAPAAAITNGAPDGNRHPNVGGLVAAPPLPPRPRGVRGGAQK